MIICAPPGRAQTSLPADQAAMRSITLIKRQLSKYEVNLQYPSKLIATERLSVGTKKSPDATVALSFAKILVTQIRRYNPRLFAKLGGLRIALAPYVAVDNKFVYAVTDAEKRQIYFAYDLGREDHEPWAHEIHHELFHVLFRRLSKNPAYYTREWTRFNSPGFHYGPQQDAANLMHPSVGFVSSYAMEAPMEDMAEVYAYSCDSESLMRLWLQSDNIIQKKSEYLDLILKRLGVRDFIPR